MFWFADSVRRAQRHAHARVARYRESKSPGAGEGMAPGKVVTHALFWKVDLPALTVGFELELAGSAAAG